VLETARRPGNDSASLHDDPEVQKADLGHDRLRSDQMSGAIGAKALYFLFSYG